MFALQEVNQSVAKPEFNVFVENGYVPCKSIRPIIRMDNHALRLDRLLRAMGMEYYWTWIPLKIGYDIYEEGLAMFSRTPITEIRQFYISKSQSMSNWKTRKILSIKTNGMWFHNVHMGWWDDAEEPFLDQWKQLEERISEKRRNGFVWLMGDFNAPDFVSGQSYEWILTNGWLDTYSAALEKDRGITVPCVIDGWKERLKDQEVKAMRLDYIFSSHRVCVKSFQVIFNGENRPVVSDHFGVFIDIKEKIV